MGLLIAALLVEIGWSIDSAHKLAVRYGRRFVDSLFFKRLVTRNQRVAYVGGGMLGFLAAYSGAVNLGLVGPLDRPWGFVTLVVALMVLLWGPIDDWRTVSRLDREQAETGETELNG